MKKFLYKIYSRYDGFTPNRIPDRTAAGQILTLGWQKYTEAVELSDRVYVYFHGPERFVNGVYVEGVVRAIDLENRRVSLRIANFKTDHPLTSIQESQRIANVVATRNQQVFLYPEDWLAAECNVATSAKSCSERQCDRCPNWRNLTLIAENEVGSPKRFANHEDRLITPFWVIPSRCYLGRQVAPRYRRGSELFYRFKTGEKNLAYPLARGMFESLRQRELDAFDCIVPIPLSPDKAAAGEINRTRLLANELAALMDIPVISALSLNRPISKRRMLATGVWTVVDFRNQYYEALTTSDELEGLDRILLLDDVCTEGTTLSQASRRIRENVQDCEIFAVTAGQMIVKQVVRNEPNLLR